MALRPFAVQSKGDTPVTDMNPSMISTPRRDDLSHPREPLFTPLDVTAFVVAVLMIWGPLVAGALRQ